MSNDDDDLRKEKIAADAACELTEDDASDLQWWLGTRLKTCVEAMLKEAVAYANDAPHWGKMRQEEVIELEQVIYELMTDFLHVQIKDARTGLEEAAYDPDEYEYVTRYTQRLRDVKKQPASEMLLEFIRGVTFLNDLRYLTDATRPLPTNPATPGFKGGDNGKKE